MNASRLRACQVQKKLETRPKNTHPPAITADIPTTSKGSALFLLSTTLLAAHTQLDEAAKMADQGHKHGASPPAPAQPSTTPQDTGAFTAYSERGITPSLADCIDIYQTITCSSPHQHFSLEELRLNDYAHERGKVVYGRPRDFVPVDGLLTAVLPDTTNWKHASPRTPTEMKVEYGSDSVILRVGKEGDSKDFLIHRDIITRRSPLVKQALSGEWKEAQDGVLLMPEDEPAIVKLYQQWLYTGCIFTDHRAAKETAAEYVTLVQCYVLGDKLFDGVFKDCIIDAIISLLLSTHLFDPSLTNLVYECTTSGSPLRKLWQDIYLFAGSSAWLDDVHDPHPDFAVELSRQQMGLWQGQRPQYGAKVFLQPCAYHEHGDQPCYRASSVSVLEEGGRSVVSALWG